MPYPLPHPTSPHTHIPYYYPNMSTNNYSIPSDDDFEPAVLKCLLRLQHRDDVPHWKSINVLSGSGAKYFIDEELPGQAYEVLPITTLPTTFHISSRCAGLLSYTTASIASQTGNLIFPNLDRILALATPSTTQFVVDFAD